MGYLAGYPNDQQWWILRLKHFDTIDWGWLQGVRLVIEGAPTWRYKDMDDSACGP